MIATRLDQRHSLGLILLFAPALVRSQAPVNCDSAWREPNAATLTGRIISDVQVVTGDPIVGPGPLRFVRAAHARTKSWAIRRMLAVRVGAPLDTLELAEGIRRLRASHEFEHVSLEHRECEGSDSAQLRVVTRDVWSAGIDARLTASSTATLSITERNFLGTTRSVAAGVSAADNRLGYTFRVSDPTLFEGRGVLSGRYTAYNDGRAHGVTFETRSPDPRPPWKLWINFSQSHRSVARDSTLTVVPTPLDSTSLDSTLVLDSLYQPVHQGYDMHRQIASVLIARRLAVIGRRGIYLLGGLERSRDDLHVAPEMRLLGPQNVTRWFRGTSVGVGVKSIHYSEVLWYSSKGEALDVPMGLEGEAVLSLGREVATDRPMQHFDAWVGRAWHPTDRILASTDVWANGFLADSGVANGTLRVAADVVVAGWGGWWIAHAAMESIKNPDPDEHALASDDPIRVVVAPRSHLSESARILYIERNLRLGRDLFARPLAIAIFGAASKRTGTLDPNFDDLVATSASVAGVGLRLMPRGPADGSLKFDLGHTLINSPLVPQRWYVTAGFSVAFGTKRRRDGWDH